MDITVNQLLTHAMDLHRLGQWQAASEEYKKILQFEPNHFTALHMLGVLACQQGDYVSGVQRIEAALRLNPQSESAYLNLYLAYEHLEDYINALRALLSLERLQPDNLETTKKIANLLLTVGLYNQVIDFLNHKLLVRSDSGVWFIQGCAFLFVDRYAEAIKSFDRVIEIDPSFLEAYMNAALAYILMHDISQAINYYDKLLLIKPSYEEALKNKKILTENNEDKNTIDVNSILKKEKHTVNQKIIQSRMLLLMGNLIGAKLHIDNCVSESINDIYLLHQQALVYLENDLLSESLAIFNLILSAQPGFISARVNKSYVLLAMGLFEQAIAECEVVLSQNPQQVIALTNLSAALIELNRHDSALPYLDAVLQIEPTNALALLNKAVCSLSLGDYSAGLPLYESRWQQPVLLQTKYYIPKPQWDGRDDLNGKTIFLYGEQGYGDNIQFARYITHIIERSGRVLLGVPADLQELLLRSFPQVELTDKTKSLPELDYHCPLGSLPLALGQRWDHLEAQVPYLVADANACAAWRGVLPRGKPRIGIVWRGNPDNVVEKKRRLPLAFIENWLSNQACWISLKKDPTIEELSWLQEHHVIDVSAQLTDFDETAGLVSQLDLVISTDTAVAHLAGALGKPVWILLPMSADWRWGREGCTSPWYPTARLYRQKILGDWQEPVHSLWRDLLEWLNTHGS